MRQTSIDEASLADLVATLRFYVVACDDSHSDELVNLSECAWEYLTRTGFKTEDGICPETTHQLVASLLLDMYTYMKLPPEKVTPIPDLRDFPGETGEVELAEFELQVTVRPDAWAITGLWLPPGVIAYVECDAIDLDLSVQVGSHQENLLPKDSPWKRWPLPVVFRSLVERSVKLVTPFGGIVYLGMAATEPVERKTVACKFKNFCRYPQINTSDPSIWEQTRDIAVPWGELVTPDVIFTLPSDRLREIDVDIVRDKYHIIVEHVCHYLAYNMQTPYRIVFDIDLLAEEPSCNFAYIVFLLSDIDPIMKDLDKPNDGLFNAIRMVTIFSIREGCFEEQTEAALATIAASVVLKKLFTGFDPLALQSIELPPLFKELWEIETEFPGVISKTLETFQSPDYPLTELVPEDMWIAFVRELCCAGQMDFTKLLEKFKPIPLNISLSLRGLPAYVPRS
jgi:hypothetical protein